MPGKENRPTRSAADGPATDARSIELDAIVFESFIAAPPTEIRRLVTALLVDELYGARRLHSESGGQVELQTGHHAVADFLALSLWAFGSGFQAFSGYGELVKLPPKSRSFKDTPALKAAALAKVEESRFVVKGVVRQYLPVLNQPGTALRGVRKLRRSFSSLPNKQERPTTSVFDQSFPYSESIRLDAEAYEEFIDLHPIEIERLVTMMLVDQLDEAQEVHFEEYEQDRVHAVTEFLLRGLLVFAAGFQRFSALGSLVILRREGLRLADSPSLSEAVRAKLDECRPVAEHVVERFSPILNDPDALAQIAQPDAVIQSAFEFE